MVDVAADLRAALLGAIGPINLDTLSEVVTDEHYVSAIRDEASNRLNTATDDPDRSRLWGVRTVAGRLLGDLAGAESDARAGLKHAEATGTDLLLSPARARLANVLRLKGDLTEADRLFALAEAGELPRRLIGRVRIGTALSCISGRRLTEALMHLEHAMDLNPDPDITDLMGPALDLVSRLASQGFGPQPRSWAERADHPAPRRFQDPRTGKWGFLDDQRKPAIPATFAEAGDFRGGIAAVRERAWGAIDTTGQLKVPFLYDRLSTPLPDGRKVVGFVNGVAVISRRGAKGVVNRNGKIILPPHFREVIVHPAGFAVDTGAATWGARDRHGDELIPSRFDRTELLRRLDTMVIVDEGPL